MMTTAPRRHLTINPEWEDIINPASPGTAIRYGNMETALVCVHDIVSAAGHVVTFTNHETIISDVGGAYTLRIPRIPDSREWRVPLHLLQRLTDLRTEHSLHNPQQHHDNV
jgi:hypothetical protein